SIWLRTRGSWVRILPTAPAIPKPLFSSENSGFFVTLFQAISGLLIFQHETPVDNPRLHKIYANCINHILQGHSRRRPRFFNLYAHFLWITYPQPRA
ncbi:MAG: hypothetical protein ACLVIG_05185, partial [Sutterella wadsworthensis]